MGWLLLLGIGLIGAHTSAGQTAYKTSSSQPSRWHDQQRTLRYHPDGQDFVISHGNKRFTRALYGTNTAFRVEAGDLPEFALYLPGMGGNLKFGLLDATGQSKWLIKAEKITARYRPGGMLYDIEDPLLGTGQLHLEVLAMADAEGMLVKARFDKVPAGQVRLLWAYGGATGKKFSRDGDIGADPESSFYLKPEYCQGNTFVLTNNAFTLQYGAEAKSTEAERYEIQPVGQTKKPTPMVRKSLLGVVPPTSATHLADAAQQDSPQQLLASKVAGAPVLTGVVPAKAGEELYVAVQKAEETVRLRYADLPSAFSKAEAARQQLANRVQVVTPDPYINTLGGALSVAADAIWEYPSYMHGSVAWRMRLNGWRGPYVADPLGWHDRAQAHFRAYAKSQLTIPAGPIVMDTTLNLARSLEKLGTSVYSDGYISRNPGGDFRPHHYDMNLVYIDALLRHFYWTGDLVFAKEMWPVLQRHLAWEKRNFDADNDGLYDAYATIWASDALQYSGGAVTHSSAYTYWSNSVAAAIAAQIGENPEPYRQEATQIRQALNTRLWQPGKGWYAEYQDALGLKQLHPSAGLWTIYHALDSEVPDAFQAYQALRYVEAEIPHIPVRAAGLPDDGYYLLSTTNWQPYDWSLNNVAMAEVLHTTLANWQAGRPEEAFKLWKSALLESMYLGSSPGNIQQISFYDANRGELYRDFADPVAMTARSLVEGLFGIVPNVLAGTLTIRPGLPMAWNSATLQVPDLGFDFKRQGNHDTYTLTPHFAKPLKLQLQVQARTTTIKSLTVNGQKAAWKNVDSAVGQPSIEVDSAPAAQYVVTIEWEGAAPDVPSLASEYATGAAMTVRLPHASITKLFDPQQILQEATAQGNELKARVAGEIGSRTAFAQLRQGELTWWAPLPVEVHQALTVNELPETNSLQFQLQNHTDAPVQARVTVGRGKRASVDAIRVPAHAMSAAIAVPAAQLVPGSNPVVVEWGKNQRVTQHLLAWAAPAQANTRYETVDLAPYYNDKVTSIFQNKYLSPRPKGPTLQLPTQGIGNWCYPLTQAIINDIGLRKLAGLQNQIQLPWGAPLRTPSAAGEKNVLFVSQWDNYKAEQTVPLKGKATHAYLLMAGSTNPMQTRLTNGEVIVTYADGSRETLALRNPENWWPIEQDYAQDGFAFTTDAPKPWRVHLQTGLVTRDFSQYTTIKGFSTRAIEGGAATVLDMPLNPQKKLKSLTVKALANDVVIGLMSATLVRE
ncbi:glycogen debranching protein [Hymenobacter crusticola]|uniref:Glycogen debranching protein n=1 Tax=Hymenobacter crusticola TaxID=1770526 RepID=A0A243WF66_9BACT|nr:glycogen debranching protein [Hymenobacter crusticola]